jgi:hypothetical protein
MERCGREQKQKRSIIGLDPSRSNLAMLDVFYSCPKCKHQAISSRIYQLNNIHLVFVAFLHSSKNLVISAKLPNLLYF